MSPVTLVDKTVKLPASSSALADGLEAFVEAVIADHKAGGGTGVELSADLAAAVQDLVPLVGSLANLGPEAQGDPLGLGEAFVLAGVSLARKEQGKLP